MAASCSGFGLTLRAKRWLSSRSSSEVKLSGWRSSAQSIYRDIGYPPRIWRHSYRTQRLFVISSDSAAITTSVLQRLLRWSFGCVAGDGRLEIDRDGTEVRHFSCDDRVPFVERFSENRSGDGGMGCRGNETATAPAMTKGPIAGTL